MIRDVKSYLNKVGDRLSNAFSIQDFDQEKQIEFWALAADLCAREEVPKFNKIASWIDVAFKAPAHFVYRREGNKLVLFRRHIISENLQHTSSEEASRNFDSKLQNLEPKLKYSDSYESTKLISSSIGQSQSIPLFHEGILWGIYCVGPYVKVPEDLSSRLSIISKILCGWFIEHHSEQNERSYKLSTRIQQSIKHGSGGDVSVENTAHYLIAYMLRVIPAEAALLVSEKESFNIIQSVNISDNLITEIVNTADADPTFSVKSFYSNNSQFFKNEDLNTLKTLKIGNNESQIYLYTFSQEINNNVDVQADILGIITASLDSLVKLKAQNQKFSTQLLSTYYQMVRNYEQQSKVKTFHTLRMVAFCNAFAELFGFNKKQKEFLLQAAKLHDIGYLSTVDKTVGKEVEHPLLGKIMLDGLSLPIEVEMGVAAHHEWVDGSGTPYGLKDDEIPWTAKVISIFEYVVNFIESDTVDDSISDDQQLKTMIDTILTRAGKEFDMLLIPTVIDLLNNLGWQKCCKLGVKDET